jgi:hypothetical protein
MTYGTYRNFPVDEEGNENREGYEESKESIDGFDISQALLPQYVVQFEADDDFLRQKMKDLPEE